MKKSLKDEKTIANALGRHPDICRELKPSQCHFWATENAHQQKSCQAHRKKRLSDALRSLYYQPQPLNTIYYQVMSQGGRHRRKRYGSTTPFIPNRRERSQTVENREGSQKLTPAPVFWSVPSLIFDKDPMASSTIIELCNGLLRQVFPEAQN